MRPTWVTWFVLLLTATTGACAGASREPAGHRDDAKTSASFAPEDFGPRIRQGAPDALRARMRLGQSEDEGAIWDIGPRVNGRGDALAVTAAYGAYRDDTAPCPAPWQAVMRWSGSGDTGELWQPKIAPRQVSATNVGFVLLDESACLPRGTTARDTSDGYVDSSGRIGQLRVTPGDPPDGVRLEAPGGPTDYYYGTTRRRRTLLADRDSDRIWSVPRPDGLPVTPDRGGESAPFVIAQDVTGRRWTLSLTDQGLSVWWSDDGGGAWTQASLAMHSDHFLYTDRTIGFTVGTSLTLSTDRGATWRTHRLPDPGTLGLPRGSHIASARDDVIPTTSGALVLHYTLPGHQQPSVLARSTDRAWSSFARVGRSPHDGLVTAKGNVLWTCDRGRPDSRGACSYSDDLGATWRSTHLPH